MAIFRIFTDCWNYRDNADRRTHRNRRRTNRGRMMIKFDDYSGQLYNTETDRKTRQPPILSKKEQRLAYYEFWNFMFWSHMMQPYSMPNHLFTGFGRKLPEPISTEEFLRRTREHIQETREYLRRRKEQHHDKG